MKLLILGAGGHGRCVKEAAEVTGDFNRIEFLDDNAENALDKLSTYDRYTAEFECAFVAMGDPELRKAWLDKLRGKYRLLSIVHPKAYISKTARVGEGSVVMAGAVIQSNVTIGKGCIISANAVIDHDTEIGDYCHINCGAVVPSMSKVSAGTKVNYNEVYHPEKNRRGQCIENT